MQTIEDTNVYTRVLDLLDSNQSESEFERHKENNRLLHLCKKHKFKNLEKAGMIQQYKDVVKVRPPRDERIEIGKKIIEMLDQDYLIQDIAEKFGIHRQSVIRWASLAGWERTKWKRQANHIVVEPSMRALIVRKVDALRAEGQDATSAAKDCGVGVSAYYRWKRTLPKDLL